MFCFVARYYVHSSLAIILVGRGELVALLSLFSRCYVIVVWLFLVVSWVCLLFVIVVYPDHTHLLFLKKADLLALWLYVFLCFCNFPIWCSGSGMSLDSIDS